MRQKGKNVKNNTRSEGCFSIYDNMERHNNPDKALESFKRAPYACLSTGSSAVPLKTKSLTKEE